MNFKRLLSLVLSLVFVLSVAQFPVAAETPAFEFTSFKTEMVDSLSVYSTQTLEDDSDYVVYQAFLPTQLTLKKSEYYANSLSDYQKSLYIAFLEAITSVDPDFLAVKQKFQLQYTIRVPANITTQEEFNTTANEIINNERAKLDAQALYNAIQYDHTELFWVRDGVSFRTGTSASYEDGEVVVDYTVEMRVDASSLFGSDGELSDAAVSMNAAVDAILEDTPTTSRYDAVKYFNDWLKENNTYNHPHLEDDGYPLAHTAYSAFTSENVEEVGPVCQGYAYALKYLCDRTNIECVVVSGTLYQTYDSPGPHAWNAIKLDDSWYGVDVTSNDSLGDDKYNFLVGSSTVSSDSTYTTFETSHVVDTLHVYPTLSETAYEVPSMEVTVLPGDVNSDGSVNNKDLGVLRRYLNDWDVEIDEIASDVNADGSVNNKDLGILRRYLNDWDVTLKSPSTTNTDSEGWIGGWY